MAVVNMIDKDRVRGEEGFGDSRAVWRARLFLFIGFALMAGGLAGSVVRLAKYASFELLLMVVRCISADGSGAQIRPARVRGAVHLLRLRQCLAECRAHAVRGGTLDIAERRQRVRVQFVHMTANAAYTSRWRTSSSILLHPFLILPTVVLNAHAYRFGIPGATGSVSYLVLQYVCY